MKSLSIQILLLSVIVGFLSLKNSYSQCTGNIYENTIVPTMNWQFENYKPGRYVDFTATAGEIYLFSLCPGDGGYSAGLDVEFTINDNSGNYVGGGAYDDDGCGTSQGPSYLQWTAPANGIYRILLNKVSCQGSNKMCKVMYRKIGTMTCPANLGTGVVNVPALPYESLGRTTCGNVNDITSLDVTVCGDGNYYGGEEEIFLFTPTTSGTISITLESNDSYSSMMLYDGCPFTGQGGSCVGFSQSADGNESICANVIAGTTYYLIVDKYLYGCIDYDLYISAPAVCPSGLGSSMVSVASLPYTSTGRTTCGQQNDVNTCNATICGSSDYYTGEDETFVFTPTTTGSITINITSSGSYTSIALYDGCPFTGGGSCVTNVQSSSGNKSLCVNVTSGTTYYLVIDSYSAFSECNAYNISISAPIVGTTGQDCITPHVIGALPFTETGLTTACAGNNYTSADPASCNTNYESGEDYVFEYTASGTECITISLNNTNQYAGFQVYDGCVDDAASSCLGYFNGATTCSGSLTFPSAGTYYIIVGTDNSGAYNTPFDITVEATTTGQTNDLPCNAYPLTLGGIVVGDNACTSGTGEPASPSCWTNGAMNTVWYSFEAPLSGEVTIRTNLLTLTNTMIAVYDGDCSTLSDPPIGCNDDLPDCDGSTWNYKNSGLTLTGLTPGETYYISVDGYMDLTGTFSILVFEGTAPPAPGQDCDMPVSICTESFTVGDPGYQAIGNICDFGDDYCLSTAERGSAWYLVTMEANGDLQFTIEPNDYAGLSDDGTDYDFAMWQMFESDGTPVSTCASIASGYDTPIRCDYDATGVTGLYGDGTSNPPNNNYTGEDYTGASWGGAFQAAVSVSAGEVYAINVSNYSNSTSGFSIDFETFSNGMIAVPAQPDVLIWTGGGANTNWFDPLNWGGCGWIPDSTTDAIIAPSSVYQPIISGVDPSIHVGYGAMCKSITINPGATLGILGGDSLNVYGDYYNSGSVSAAGLSIVEFKGKNEQTLDGNLLGSSKFGKLSVKKWGGYVKFLQNIEIANSLITYNSASILYGNTKKIKVGGDVTFYEATFTPGTGGIIEAYGSLTPQYFTTNANHLYDLIVNKNATSNSVLLNDPLHMDNDITLQFGLLDVSTGNHTIYMYLGGDWINTGGDFAYQQGSVTFIGTLNQTITSDNDAFYDVVMDKSGKLLLIDPITIMNDNILTSGYFDINTTNNQVTIYGDWVNNGGNFICRYGTVLFTGGGLQEFNKKLDGTVNLSDFNFYNVTINSPDVQFFYDSDNHKVNIINNLVINSGMKISNLDQ